MWLKSVDVRISGTQGERHRRGEPKGVQLVYDGIVREYTDVYVFTLQKAEECLYPTSPTELEVFERAPVHPFRDEPLYCYGIPSGAECHLGILQHSQGSFGGSQGTHLLSHVAKQSQSAPDVRGGAIRHGSTGEG
jgi:hypothetical protein